VNQLLQKLGSTLDADGGHDDDDDDDDDEVDTDDVDTLSVLFAKCRGVFFFTIIPAMVNEYMPLICSGNAGVGVFFTKVDPSDNNDTLSKDWSGPSAYSLTVLETGGEGAGILFQSSGGGGNPGIEEVLVFVISESAVENIRSIGSNDGPVVIRNRHKDTHEWSLNNFLDSNGDLWETAGETVSVAVDTKTVLREINFEGAILNARTVSNEHFYASQLQPDCASLMQDVREKMHHLTERGRRVLSERSNSKQADATVATSVEITSSDKEAVGVSSAQSEAGEDEPERESFQSINESVERDTQE